MARSFTQSIMMNGIFSLPTQCPGLYWKRYANEFLPFLLLTLMFWTLYLPLMIEGFKLKLIMIKVLFTLFGKEIGNLGKISSVF